MASLRSFGALLLQDIKFELRHGMYTLYAVVCGLYILLLLSMPEGARRLIIPLLVFSDPGALGFFFIGGMVLLERKQDVLSSLFVTPVSPGRYVSAKAVSLALISLVSSLCIILPFYGFEANLFVFCLGVVLTSGFISLISVPFAVHARTLNEYFFSSMVAFLLFAPPMIDYFLQTGHVFFRFFPTDASLTLIRASLEAVDTGIIAGSAAYLSAWIIGAWFWARGSVGRYIHRLRGGAL